MIEVRKSELCLMKNEVDVISFRTTNGSSLIFIISIADFVPLRTLCLWSTLFKIITLRLTLNFWLIIRNTFLKHYKQWNLKKETLAIILTMLPKKMLNKFLLFLQIFKKYFYSPSHPYEADHYLGISL